MWAVATVLDSTGTRPMFLPFNALILSVTHVQYKELNSPTRFFVTNTVVHCSLWQTLSAPHSLGAFSMFWSNTLAPLYPDPTDSAL